MFSILSAPAALISSSLQTRLAGYILRATLGRIFVIDETLSLLANALSFELSDLSFNKAFLADRLPGFAVQEARLAKLNIRLSEPFSLSSILYIDVQGLSVILNAQDVRDVSAESIYDAFQRDGHQVAQDLAQSLVLDDSLVEDMPGGFESAKTPENKGLIASLIERLLARLHFTLREASVRVNIKASQEAQLGCQFAVHAVQVLPESSVNTRQRHIEVVNVQVTLYGSLEDDDSRESSPAISEDLAMSLAIADLRDQDESVYLSADEDSSSDHVRHTEAKASSSSGSESDAERSHLILSTGQSAIILCLDFNDQRIQPTNASLTWPMLSISMLPWTIEAFFDVYTFYVRNSAPFEPQPAIQRGHPSMDLQADLDHLNLTVEYDDPLVENASPPAFRVKAVGCEFHKLASGVTLAINDIGIQEICDSQTVDILKLDICDAGLAEPDDSSSVQSKRRKISGIYYDARGDAVSLTIHPLKMFVDLAVLDRINRFSTFLTDLMTSLPDSSGTRPKAQVDDTKILRFSSQAIHIGLLCPVQRDKTNSTVLLSLDVRNISLDSSGSGQSLAYNAYARAIIVSIGQNSESSHRILHISTGNGEDDAVPDGPAMKLCIIPSKSTDRSSKIVAALAVRTLDCHLDKASFDGVQLFADHLSQILVSSRQYSDDLLGSRYFGFKSIYLNRKRDISRESSESTASLPESAGLRKFEAAIDLEDVTLSIQLSLIESLEMCVKAVQMNILQDKEDTPVKTNLTFGLVCPRFSIQRNTDSVIAIVCEPAIKREEPMTSLKLVSSSSVESGKETRVSLIIQHIACHLDPDLRWLGGLLIFLKPPKGVFETAEASEKTRVKFRARNMSINLGNYATSHLNALDFDVSLSPLETVNNGSLTLDKFVVVVKDLTQFDVFRLCDLRSRLRVRNGSILPDFEMAVEHANAQAAVSKKAIEVLTTFASSLQFPTRAAKTPVTSDASMNVNDSLDVDQSFQASSEADADLSIKESSCDDLSSLSELIVDDLPTRPIFLASSASKVDSPHPARSSMATVRMLASDGLQITENYLVPESYVDASARLLQSSSIAITFDDTDVVLRMYDTTIAEDARPAISIHVSSVAGHYLVFPSTVSQATSLSVTMMSFDIEDGLSSSTWRKFLTEMRPHDGGIARPAGAPMVKAELAQFREGRIIEHTLRVKISPLRLHVDQDAIDFLKNLASTDGAAKADVLPSEGEEAHIKRVEISPVKIKLDYKPRRVDYQGIRQGRAIELMNFFHFEGSEMTLRRITLSNIRGWSRVSDLLQDIWTPDIKANQLSDVISGIAPIRSAVNIGSGMADLVLLPMEQYKRDKQLIKGVQRGATSFTRATAIEAARLGARLATGTQVILEHASAVLGARISQDLTVTAVDSVGTDTASPTSRYSRQPLDLQDGLRQASAGLSEALKSTGQTILAIPMETYERSGPSGTMRAVLRAIPIAVLQPSIGATHAITKTLQGVSNQLDPHASSRQHDKYK